VIPDISKFILLLLLIAATYKSYRQAILPYKLTLGGAACGCVLSFLFPQWWGQTSQLAALGNSLFGFFTGFFAAWILIELGKCIFGKASKSFEEPVTWRVGQPAEDLPPVIYVGCESYRWEDVFMRATDCMVLECPALTVSGGYSFENVTAYLKMESLEVRSLNSLQTTRFELQNVTFLEGTAKSVVIPREAMGFGVAFLSAMTGSFVGPMLALYVFGGALLTLSLVIGLYACSSREPASRRMEIAPFMVVSYLLVMTLRHFAIV
jgi:leader peptidase (prepilin peptidase)/N-methyltransferase